MKYSHGLKPKCTLARHENKTPKNSEKTETEKRKTKAHRRGPVHRRKKKCVLCPCLAFVPCIRTFAVLYTLDTNS